jgi:hypothetical protein
VHAYHPNYELEELKLMKERKYQRTEMTATDYYINESSDEWESVERWENEGGRLRQNHDLSLDPIGEDYLRRMEEAIPHRRARLTE